MPALAEQRLNEPVLNFARQDYVRVFADQTIGEALAYVQQSGAGEGRIVYFYVVDRDNRLTGVVPTRHLLLNPPSTPIRQIMFERVIALPSEATLLDACDLFLFHRLLALPIVDEDRHLMGIVDVEVYTQELTDLARHAESDDIFQLIGVHVAAVRQASIPIVFWHRFPWLMCNIAGGLGCAAIAAFYENVLGQVIALALFIPVVLALAESVSIQSLTLTLQAQHGQVFQWRLLGRNLVRELPVGVMLGLGCGLLVAASAWLWLDRPWLPREHGEDGQGLPIAVGLCILLSILASITSAAVFGLLVPTMLRAFQRDPKVASGPITLAMTDLVTMFYYLGLATLLLG